MSRSTYTMSLRHAVLGALADEPRSGYALLKHFGQSLGYAWPASHSQIYPELARLVDEGLIEQTGAGARNSKTYALTDAGLDEIRRWLESTMPERRVRNDATLRMFFLAARARGGRRAPGARARLLGHDPRRVPSHQRGADRREQEGPDLPDRPRRRDPRHRVAHRVARLGHRAGPAPPKWRSLA